MNATKKYLFCLTFCFCILMIFVIFFILFVVLPNQTNQTAEISNTQKTILIHYINGDIETYNRNPNDIKVWSHLSLIQIHNASYPDVTYIPFHNIKFFMITDNKTVIPDGIEK